MKIACLVMAAGAGRRFAGCKQLAEVEGEPLILRSVKQLKPVFSNDLIIGDLFIVLGAYRERIEPLLEGQGQIIFNPRWNEGLGSSIATAVGVIDRLNQYDGVMITLADQYRLTTADFKKLLSLFNGEQIVAAFYADHPGVPAVFPRAYFKQLQQLAGDSGAKVILQASREQLISCPLAAANTDLDYPDDLPERIKSSI